jgi:hypothetical protein
MSSGILRRRSLSTFQRCLLHPSIIALMMEAARTSETSVNFYQTTRRNIPEKKVKIYFDSDNKQ